MYDTPNSGRQYSDKRLDHYWWDAFKDSYVKGVPLYAAPPAAAHGDEVEVIATLSVKDYFPNTGLSQPHLDFTWAISPDREREILRTMKGPIKLVAMRTQSKGDER